MTVQRILFGALALAMAYGSTASAADPTQAQLKSVLLKRLHRSPTPPPAAAPAPLSAGQKLTMLRAHFADIHVVTPPGRTLAHFPTNAVAPTSIKLSLAQPMVPGGYLQFVEATGDENANYLQWNGASSGVVINATMVQGQTYLLDVLVGGDSTSYNILYVCDTVFDATSVTVPVISGHLLAPITATTSQCGMVIQTNGNGTFYSAEISKLS
jgi:hypothetical protein